MAIVDIIIIVAAFASVVVGWFRGIVKEAISIFTLLVAIWASLHLGPYASGYFGGNPGSTELQLWSGRLLVFVVILVGGAFAGWGISKIVHMSGLSGMDRGFGSFFGMVRAVLFVGVFVLGGRYAGFDSNLWWLESKILPYGEQVADWIIIMAPRGMEILNPEMAQIDPRLFCISTTQVTT